MSSTSTPRPEEGPNRAGFVFGDSNESGPNKVLGLLPVSTYLVQYTDGAGQKSVRLVFKAEDSKTSFILNEKVQGQFIATAATGWFNKELAKKLRTLGIGVNPNEGPEGAESV